MNDFGRFTDHHRRPRFLQFWPRQPVAVGYPAKRGVVAAASYEARAFGVRSAMPSIVAARKCAELVFVPPRFDVYREVSKQVQAIFKDYTPLVEPLSLDEAYLDITDNLKGIPTAWETAKEIRARIYEETKLTASAGISCNKFLAKLASDHRKPNGQFAIMPDQAEAFVAALPVAKFHGVGPRTAAKMYALGIETGADLRGQTLAFLQDRFGKAGNWYFEIARGQDDRPVQADRERKSSGSETTFPEDLIDPVQIEAPALRAKTLLSRDSSLRNFHSQLRNHCQGLNGCTRSSRAAIVWLRASPMAMCTC